MIGSEVAFTAFQGLGSHFMSPSHFFAAKSVIQAHKPKASTESIDCCQRSSQIIKGSIGSSQIANSDVGSITAIDVGLVTAIDVGSITAIDVGLVTAIDVGSINASISSRGISSLVNCSSLTRTVKGAASPLRSRLAYLHCYSC